MCANKQDFLVDIGTVLEVLRPRAKWPVLDTTRVSEELVGTGTLRKLDGLRRTAHNFLEVLEST